MRHSFSAQFLKIVPPATNFGEAWENLCLCLLRAETSDPTIMRLGPPDRGIDIFRQRKSAAYQCKSSEHGALGTIDPRDYVTSLARAIQASLQIPWQQYSLALNAPLSGAGFSKISEFARSQGVAESELSILPPEYWDQLCERYPAAIQDLFDYRMLVSEAEVVEAFRKARYYDRIITQALEQMTERPLDVTVSNNRTPVLLTLPFSGELTVEELLHVV